MRELKMYEIKVKQIHNLVEMYNINLFHDRMCQHSGVPYNITLSFEDLYLRGRNAAFN